MRAIIFICTVLPTPLCPQSPPFPHSSMFTFFLYSSLDPRDLHSFPTRRSSDLSLEISRGLGHEAWHYWSAHPACGGHGPHRLRGERHLQAVLGGADG